MAAAAAAAAASRVMGDSPDMPAGRSVLPEQATPTERATTNADSQTAFVRQASGVCVDSSTTNGGLTGPANASNAHAGKPASGGSTCQLQSQQRRRRSSWGSLLSSPYIRRAVQSSFGTCAILLLFGTPPVYWALTLNPTAVRSPMPHAFTLVIFFIVLLVSLSTGQAPIRVAGEQLVGSLMGGGFGLAAVYLTYAINGGYHNTVAKAASMASLSAAILFVATVCRFCYTEHTLAFQFMSLTFAITTAASYHAKSDDLYKLTLFWMAYSCIGGSVAYLCATFVLPITAGGIVRAQLASGLRHTADTLNQTLALISGEVAPDTGLLAAASGETAERIGLDGGLYPQLEPLYVSVTLAGQAIQEAFRHLDHAPAQLDVYRRQRRFRKRPHYLLTTMARSLLNAVMMLVYPAQTGTMHVTLVARHRGPLLELGRAVAEYCQALGDTLVQNAPASVVLASLAEVEACYARLAAATRFKGSTLTQDTLALDMVLSLLFTACTRLRRMAVLLPEALGRDQPCSLQPVVDYFTSEVEEGAETGRAAGSGIHWDFAALTHIPLPHQDSDPIELLRASLLAAQPRRSASASAKVLQLVSQPEVVRLPRAPAPEGRMPRLWARLQASTGIQAQHLALGCQCLAAYTPVLIMLTITPVYTAFSGSLSWALFVIVSVLEPSTGAAIFKGGQRLVGTVIAGLLGVSAQYLTFLINGMSYDNTALKFATMTIILTLLAGVLAAASGRFPRYSYAAIIACVMLGLTALPGFQTGEVQPIFAAWRVAATSLGVAFEVAAVSLVFPVTARQLFRDVMAATLDQLSVVSAMSFSSFLPQTIKKSASCRSLRLPAEGGTQAGQQQAGQKLGQQGQQGQQGQRSTPVQSRQASPERELLRGLPAEQPLSEVPPPRHVTIEMQGGRQATLRAVRTRAGGEEGAGLAEMLATPGETITPCGVRQAGRLARGSWIQPQHGVTMTIPQLTPLGSAGSAFRRRRSAGGSGVLSPAGSASLAAFGEPVLSSSPSSEASDDSEASGVLSITATVGKTMTFKIIGSVYASFLPEAFSAAGGIVTMLQLNPALHYEYYPFRRRHRFPFDCGFRAQRLCRHMLNIVAGAVIMLDSHEAEALPMLAPHAARLELLIEQLSACLEGLAEMVRGHQPPDRAVEAVLSLEEHVQRFFVCVLAGHDMPAGLAEADVITGLALLAVLVNASYVARLLAVSLARSFAPSDSGSGQAAAEAVLLQEGRATRWAADARVLQLGLGILGVALGAGSTSAASASGMITPRARTGSGGGWAGGEAVLGRSPVPAGSPIGSPPMSPRCLM